jgi:hypothetical protein
MPTVVANSSICVSVKSGFAPSVDMLNEIQSKSKPRQCSMNRESLNTRRNMRRKKKEHVATTVNKDI